MDSQAPLLDIEDLSISYYTRAGEIPAVIDFSLQVKAGESVGLVGESGCGKSTVAMAIMGYLGRNGAIVGGRIGFKGRELTTAGQDELRALRGGEIGMVYQEPMAALNPSMTIERQLMEVPIQHRGIGRREARHLAAAMLADVRLPDPELIMTKYPHQISGGQQQRVVIAMALLGNPSLLLLDEPTTALDVTVEASIVKLIAEISERHGTALVYISHNLGLIREVCGRVCVMYSGEVVEEGREDDLFRAPRHPYTRGLFECIPLPSMDKIARPLMPIRGQLPLPHERPQGCNFAPRCDHIKAGLCDAGPIPLMKVTDAGAARRSRCLRWDEIAWEVPTEAREHAAAVDTGTVVLEVEDLKKYYKVRSSPFGGETRWVKANEALNFDAREGETVAIVGESGCGKSTFAKVLMGLETATGGTIRLGGQELGGQPVKRRATTTLRAMQMVFQNPHDTLNPSITVGGQIARVISKFGVESDSTKVMARVQRLLDLVKLPRDFAKRRPRQLSGGQKQRVAIARAFAGHPEVLVADEPVSALDVSVQAAITELLMDLQRKHRTTLLFISHDLSVVRYLADRVVVMYLGRIMERGRTKDVFQPPYHPYTEALLSAVPIADPGVEKREIVLEGSPPSALNPPSGCPFHTRCPRKIGAICETELPPEREAGDDHVILCHIPLEELRLVPPVFTQTEAAAAE